MPFDTFAFAVFISIVFPLYLALRHKSQNYMLIVASYTFYGWWSWKFLSLIFISTVLDYYCSNRIATSQDQRYRKQLMWLSVAGNLGILGFFKYFNFFQENFRGLLGVFGFQVDPFLLDVFLPAGISFYTFQTMAYTIDVYNKRLEPSRKFLDFMLYVSFFPQLVAGPIERASHLLPQIVQKRTVTRAKVYEGGWLVFWGLYKKIFIADNLGPMVDKIYSDPGQYTFLHILVATYAFAIQIYCDFSGYTDVARGVARAMGFDLMHNFNLPYFSRDPQDHWRRWHISLSRWLRDYLYIPLGGNRGTQGRIMFNLIATMTLGGLWHGASWNFVIWGFYHGILLVAYRIVEGYNPVENAGRLRRAFQILVMFHWTCLGYMIFRVPGMGGFWEIIQSAFTNFAGSWQAIGAAAQDFGVMLLYSALIIILEAMMLVKNDLLVVQRLPARLRIIIYIIMYFSLTLGGATDGRLFIYFQF